MFLGYSLVLFGEWNSGLRFSFWFVMNFVLEVGLGSGYRCLSWLFVSFRS